MNTEIASALLGVECDSIQTSEADDIRLALQHMCSQSRDIVRISSPYLNPAFFDNEKLRSALSELARHNRYTEVRILVSHCKAIADSGHHLLHLSRRLSSAVAMRQLVLPEQQLQSFDLGNLMRAFFSCWPWMPRPRLVFENDVAIGNALYSGSPNSANSFGSDL